MGRDGGSQVGGYHHCSIIAIVASKNSNQNIILQKNYTNKQTDNVDDKKGKKSRAINTTKKCRHKIFNEKQKVETKKSKNKNTHTYIEKY